MALIPDRAVVLTAASTAVADIMETYYGSLGTSAWTATKQIPTSTGGAGSFAMTLQNAAGDLELNMLNYGNPVQAAGSPDPSQPHASYVRLGINPDGSADPIQNCDDPYGTPGGTGPANFSGADNGPTANSVIGSPEFIVLEWPDAILFLFKDVAKNFVPWMWYWGRAWQPVMSELANIGKLRMDGNIIFQGKPGSGNNEYVCITTYTPRIRRRIALGNTVDTAPAYLLGWAGSIANSNDLSTTSVTSSAYFRYGPDNVYIVHAFVFRPCDATASPDCYIDKYMRNVPSGNAPFDIWTIGAVNRYMVIWDAWTTGAYIGVPIPYDFNPRPSP